MCVDSRSLRKCAEFGVGVCVVGGAVLWGGVFGWDGYGVVEEGVNTLTLYCVVVAWELWDAVGGVVEFAVRSWR